jgi:hypothetical protein
MPPSAVDDLPAADLILLDRYWQAEPWGPWRDNLHAAIIAREVRRPYLRRGAKNPLDDFMVMQPARRAELAAEQARAASAALVDMLRAVARKRGAGDRPSKTSRPT